MNAKNEQKYSYVKNSALNVFIKLLPTFQPQFIGSFFCAFLDFAILLLK